MPWESDELGMRIDFPRLKRDLTELGAIGRTAEGGVSRPSFSEADMRALKYHVQAPNGQYDGRARQSLLVAGGSPGHPHAHAAETVDLADRTARYARIQLVKRMQLHFHECEVYGC